MTPQNTTRWNPTLAALRVAALAALWGAATHADEPTAFLHWKNGDVLPGRMLDSGPHQVRWAAPQFADDLRVDRAALDSILFPKQPVSPAGTFRVATTSGDVWTADLIGSDDDALAFSSERFGRFRIRRHAIASLSRREHPDLLFDVSRLQVGYEIDRATTSGDDAGDGWRRDSSGRPMTDLAKASIFRSLELPQRFEIDLELASTESPRFVFALGRDQARALRLETRDDELVAIQDALFEPVSTIDKDQRDVRLRIAFDGVSNVLQVFDATGRQLVKLDGVRAATDAPGIFIRSRGKDLTIRRLHVYRQRNVAPAQQVDPSRPRVRFVDGSIVYGRLFVGEGDAYVLESNGTRRGVDLQLVDRIARPDVRMARATEGVELTYGDGAIVRGRLERLSADRITLRTAYAEAPLRCALEGATVLKLARPEPGGVSAGPDEGDDLLSFSSGRVRGRLTFGAVGSPLGWKPEGAVEPVRLAAREVADVERSDEHVLRVRTFDIAEFPHVLFLKSGEVIPCRVESYDEKAAAFRSPFISGRSLDTAHVRGIRFSGETQGGDGEQPVAVDRARLARALTVPRMYRDNPPRHLLVGKNGDLKRGNLLSIRGHTVRFESKLRELPLPLDRIAGVVDVSRPGDDANEAAAVAPPPEGEVRAILGAGWRLVFEPVESRDGKLLGRSMIYGELSIPTAAIRRLQFGDLDDERFEALFADWTVRPAKEPEWPEQEAHGQPVE